MFLDIVEEVITGDMSFDMRGKLREVRIVFDERDPEHAVVLMITDGHHNQAFNINLGEDNDDVIANS